MKIGRGRYKRGGQHSGRYKRNTEVMMKIIALLLACFFLICTVHNDTGDGAIIRDLLDTGYDVRRIPLFPNSGPVEVTISANVYSILSMDEKQSVFTAISLLTLTWVDARLVWDPQEYDNVTDIVLTSTDIWVPTFDIGNYATTDKKDPFSNAICYVTHQGDVRMQSTFAHSTTCPSSLLNFPFDMHACPIYAEAPNTPSTKVQWRAGDYGYTQIVNHPEWEVKGVSAIVSNGNNSVNEGNQVYIIMYITVQRLASFYLRNILLPIILINLLALLSFLIPLNSGERISSCVSLVLGLTIFQIVLADILPKTSRPGEEPLLVAYAVSSFIVLVSIAMASMITANVSVQKVRIRNRLVCAFLYGFLGKLVFVRPWTCTRRCRCSRIEEDPSSPKGTDRKTHATENGSIATISSTAENQSNAESDMEQLAVILDRLFFITFVIVDIVVIINARVLVESALRNP